MLQGGYSYSGQRCTAVKVVLVAQEVADELVAKVKKGVEGLSVGMPEVSCPWSIWNVLFAYVKSIDSNSPTTCSFKWPAARLGKAVPCCKIFLPAERHVPFACHSYKCHILSVITPCMIPALQTAT